LKLAKTTHVNWSNLTASSNTPFVLPTQAGPSTSSKTSTIAKEEKEVKKKPQRNWDKVVDEELDEKEDSKDPVSS
jgi:hypothetical protein